MVAFPAFSSVKVVFKLPSVGAVKWTIDETLQTPTEFHKCARCRFPTECNTSMITYRYKQEDVLCESSCVQTWYVLHISHCFE